MKTSFDIHITVLAMDFDEMRVNDPAFIFHSYLQDACVYLRQGGKASSDGISMHMYVPQQE